MSDTLHTSPLLSVRDLGRRFAMPRSHLLQRAPELVALQGVNFDLQPGRSLGIVGESGSGKSVSFLSIMGLPARN